MTTPTTSNTRIAKNSLFMTIRMLLLMIITLYSSRVILEALGVVDFGIYNVVAGFVTMFAFMSTSLSSGIQRFFNFELGKSGIEGATKVYNAAIIIQVVFAIFLIILLETVGIWYMQNKLVIPTERMFAAHWVFQLAIITLILHLLQVPFMAAVMAHERMGFYAIISVLNAVILLISVFIIKYLSFDALILYAIIQVLVAAFAMGAFAIFAKRKFAEIRFDRTYIDKGLIKEMLSFSGWNIFGTFGHMLKDQGVNLILNSFFGPILNAARGIAVQINSALNSLVSNITIPVRPQLVQAYSQGNKIRTYNLTFSISKLTSYALLLMAIPIILEIDFILRIWLGNNVPEYSNVFAILIIADSFILNLNASISSVVHASGKMKWYQLSGGTVSLISVIFAYVGLLIYKDPCIVFWSILLFDIVRQILAVAIAIRIENNQLFTAKKYLREVIVPVGMVTFLSLPLPFLCHFAIESVILRFVVTTLVATISLFISAYYIGLNANERHLLKPVIEKFKKHK